MKEIHSKDCRVLIMLKRFTQSLIFSTAFPGDLSVPVLKTESFLQNLLNETHNTSSQSKVNAHVPASDMPFEN